MFRSNADLFKVSIFSVIPDCPEEVSSFLGSPGLMITGHTEPPLEGVVITVVTEEDGVMTTSTDKDGRYR